MHGPEILARSLTQAKVPDKFGNEWQYHSRSDNHSKIACWALLFDVVQTCPLLVEHIENQKLHFGINHEMRDFKTGRKKNLDLVLCTPGTPKNKREANDKTTFADLADRYNIDLTAAERKMLGSFPKLVRAPVGSVHVALEAKACMTEHIKALPRLYDELNSSHLAIHGSAEFAIAAGFAVVNLAATFISSDRNKYNLRKKAAHVTEHKQPHATIRTLEKLREIPRRTQQGTEGFDALGVIVLEMKNDGSEVEIVTKPPAPPPQDVVHYDQMIRRIASSYANKFHNI